RVVLRGSPDSHQFVAWYLQGDKILAADCINSPREFMQAKKIIGQQLALKATDLADCQQDLAQLVLSVAAA
ncbi:MAG: oxidoreductase C-terminal domain-containing protein, partial [Ketobacter sp.]